MLPWITDEYAAEFGRPMPWHEMVAIEALEDLAWKVSARAKHPTGDLALAVSRAMHEIKRFKDASGLHYGGTEALDAAVKRLAVPTDGMVYLIRSGRPQAMLIAMSELVVFGTLLWHDDSFAVDIDGRWVLAGLHDDAARYAVIAD